MTQPENGKPPWDESRVEMLLEEFFQREIPAPLRQPNPARIPRSQLAAPSSSANAPSRAANSRANSKTGGVMVGFTLMLLLMMALIVWNPISQTSDDVRSEGNRHSDDTSDSQANDHDEGVLKALKHDRQGPIELRPRIQSVGTEDPENHNSRKSPFPELDVEVYPLDVEAPAKQEKPRKPSVQKPMPEEGRALPESQPPAVDPDEARLEPMLPELEAIFPASDLD
jgi:hypothetical protein